MFLHLVNGSDFPAECKESTQGMLDNMDIPLELDWTAFRRNFRGTEDLGSVPEPQDIVSHVTPSGVALFKERLHVYVEHFPSQVTPLPPAPTCSLAKRRWKGIQGYLAHKKPHSPLGTPDDPRNSPTVGS